MKYLKKVFGDIHRNKDVDRNISNQVINEKYGEEFPTIAFNNALNSTLAKDLFGFAKESRNIAITESYFFRSACLRLFYRFIFHRDHSFKKHTSKWSRERVNICNEDLFQRLTGL